MRGAVLALALVLAGVGPLAADVAVDLRAAGTALQSGEYKRAVYLAGPVARDPATARPDRAEGWRILGLALFFLERRAEAEEALLEYLKLDVEAHLDPVLVPPEAIAFFEDVRLRHAGELRRYRPPPKRRRYLMLLPPLGQLENGERTKGWVLGIAGVTAIGTSLATFGLVRRWCGGSDQTCIEGRTDDARTLRSVNHFATAAAIGIYVYGVVDAYVVDRGLRQDEDRTQLGLLPVDDGGAMVVWGGTF